jgi:Nucleoside-diphosphate-sugar epimerases
MPVDLWRIAHAYGIILAVDTVLITGGAGFLGYHLAHHFAHKGVRPALLDIAPYEESEYPDGTLFFKGDVRNRNEVRAALERRVRAGSFTRARCPCGSAPTSSA